MSYNDGMPSIKEVISELEFNLKLAKEIQVAYPKTTISGFFGNKDFYCSSSEVNNTFTDYAIEADYRYLKIRPYIPHLFHVDG